MTAATLFPSVLGTHFAALDPCLRWVHSGEPRTLRGSVTVERGSGVVARMLGVLALIPAVMSVLEHIGAFGFALPLKWFRIAATIKARDGRYHFVVDSELIGVGRIVRYEGLLDAAA